MATWALVLLIGLQIIFFSRGAIAIQFLSGLAIVFADMIIRTRKLQRLSLLFLVPFILSLSTQLFRDYWQNKATVDVRIEQQKALFKISTQFNGQDESLGSFVRRISFGYGPGGYGAKFFNSSHAGTHNFFLDTYLAGGVISLLAILSIFAWPIVNLFKHTMRSGTFDDFFVVKFLMIATTVVLAFRELDFIYLFKLNQYSFVFFFAYFLMFTFEEVAPTE
ncbi:MAG: hypothetical protein J0L82_06005 [Deltaproteobacteria bacterium]|nr:hypothetical protein [Deltaproteobacteria bacterium]